MVAPEWLIKIFIMLGLKTSEEQRILREIAASEENIRSLNKNAETIVNEIKNIELCYRETKAEYDSLKGVARETARIRLDNLLKQRERFSERNALLEQQLNAETLVHDNLKLQLEYLHSRSAEELDDNEHGKKVFIDDVKENVLATKRLEKARLSPSKDPASDNSNDTHSREVNNYDTVLERLN